MVSMLEYQSRSSGLKFRPRQEFVSRFLLHLRPLTNLAMTITLTVHYQWKDETVLERTDHPPSYAEAKKMKSPNPYLP